MVVSSPLSIYRNAHDNRGVKGTLLDISYRVVGSDRLQAATDTLRGMERGDEYDRFKATQFPAATFSGLFSRRAKAGLISHTSMMGIDLDHLDEPADEVRDALAMSIYTLFAFVSPSGDGVKAFYTVDPIPQNAEEHRQAWLTTSDKYMGLTGVQYPPDEKCKDVSRLCFIPYDRDAYFTDASDAIKWTMPPPEQPSKNGQRGSRPEEDRIISLALNSAPPSDYNVWLGLISALKSAGVSMEEVDAWSRRGDYKEGEIRSRWAGLPHSDTPIRTIAGIIKGQGVDIAWPLCPNCRINKRNPKYEVCYDCRW